MLDKLLSYFKPKQKPLSPLAQAIVESTKEPFRWKLRSGIATDTFPRLVDLVDTKHGVEIIVDISDGVVDVNEYSVKREYGVEMKEALIIKKALAKIAEAQFHSYRKLAEEKLAKQKQEEIKPSEASQGIRCTSCNPSQYRTPHKSYKDFVNDITLPDGWSICCNTWNGVCDSKIILTHSCGYSTERLSHSIKAFTGFCKRCSDEAKRLINEQKEVDKKNKRENKNKKELTDMLDLAKVVHNCEFDYDLSKLNSHDFMFKAINTPIGITHKSCGSVLNKSLSYHVQGGPDGQPTGCPMCASFGYSYTNGSYFYIVTSNDGMFKIGITKNPEQRVAQMNRNKDRVWTKHWQIKLEGDLRPLEKEVLGMLDVMYPKPNCVFDGSTESFVVYGGIVPLSFVKEICSSCLK